jgi:hypothetical protein
MALAFRIPRINRRLTPTWNERVASMQRDALNALDSDAFVLAFTDEADRRWEVREIRVPLLPDRGTVLMRQEYAEGWLLFVSGNERRRLAPFPPGWRFADAARLRRWVDDALPVRIANGMSPEPPASQLSQLSGSSSHPD